MENFLPVRDSLSRTINEQAGNLYARIQSLQVDALGLPYYCQEYFKSSHSTRLFFSVETSARLLYKAIQTTGKQSSELVIMDYGAGVGTLYLLAGMLGCKKVVYNDHLEDWKFSAETIARAIGIHIDEYIVGDIDATLTVLRNKDIQCDLIVSRNVLEHIYRPEAFFRSIHSYSTTCIVFSSTTANASNPGSVWKHRRWHAKWEKEFVEQRKKRIRELIPEINERSMTALAAATRGLAMQDLDNAILSYRQSGKIMRTAVEGTNTCDPANGVWFENLLSFNTWGQLIQAAGYEVVFEPGFWDTHYSRKWKNMAGRALNGLSKAGKIWALATSPFIYIIAKPKA